MLKMTCFRIFNYNTGDFPFQPVFYDWYNKGRGMCYPICGVMHIKDPLLLIEKSSLCSGAAGYLSRYVRGS